MTTKVPAVMQSADGAPAVRATSTAIAIPTGTGSATPFEVYGAPQFDPTDALDLLTGRFTPDVAGWYQVNATVDYTANSLTATHVGAQIRKNGVVHAASITGASGAAIRLGVSDLIYLNGSTDYVDVATLHNAAGSAVNVTATLSAILVRAA